VLTAFGAHAAGFATARRCLRFLVSFLIELRLVTDGRPDGQTQIHSIYRASIALRGKNRAWSSPEKIKYVKTKQNNAASVTF